MTIQHALTARDAARTRHQEAAAALERARHAHSAAAADVQRLAAEERGWLDRHARKLGEWISAGSTGSRPEPKADAQVLVRQAGARAQLAAADAALESFTRAERESRQALTDAEAAVHRAGRAQVAAERDAIEKQILDRDAETDALRGLVRASREFVPPTAQTRRAAPCPGDWQFTTLPELRAQEERAQQRVEVSPADVEYWQLRLAALLSGEAASPEPAAERAA